MRYTRRFVGAAERAEAEAAQMRLMREEIGYASANLGRERANVRAAYEELGKAIKSETQRRSAWQTLLDRRNGLLCGDVVDAGAVCFGEFSMRWIRRLLGSIQSFDRDAAPEREEADAAPEREEADAAPEREEADAAPEREEADAAPEREEADAAPEREEADAAPEREEAARRREAARKGSLKRAATLARKRAIAEKARAEARAAFGGGIYLARCVYTYGWQEYGVYAKDVEHAQFLMEQWLRSDDGKSEITTLHEDAVSNYQSAMEDYRDVIKDYRAEKKAGVLDEELDLSRPKTKPGKTEFKLSVKTITKSNLDTKDFEIEEVQFHDASDGWNHDINVP